MCKREAESQKKKIISSVPAARADPKAKAPPHLRQQHHLEAPLHLPNGQLAVQAVGAGQNKHLWLAHAQERRAQARVPALPARQWCPRDGMLPARIALNSYATHVRASTEACSCACDGSME